jgi:glycosyltransferase involved in cell wall biosynthesis
MWGGEDIVFDNERYALQQTLPNGSVYAYTVSNDDLNFFKLAIGIWGSRKHAKNITTLIKKYKIDIVHFHNTFPQITPFVFNAVSESGAKCVVTLHNYRLWCIAGSFRDPQGKNCHICLVDKTRRAAIEKRCYRNSKAASALSAKAHALYERRGDLKSVDAIFTLSNTQKKALIACGISEKKLFDKPNFVNSEKIVPAAKKSGLIFVGRLETEKRIVLFT